MKKDIIEVTAEQVLASSAGDYNPGVWREKVERYQKLGAKFYQSCTEGEVFYVTHWLKEEGLLFLRELTMYSVLSCAGFTRAIIRDDELGNTTLELKGFGPENKVRVANSKEGRRWLAENICKHGVAVSTEG
jgi:hypothetical protein